MYVIERGTSAWLCTTAIEAFEVQAVQIRLQGELKDFDKFRLRLTKGDIINAGVIKVYKCDATTCEDCEKSTKCEIRLKAIETIESHKAWVKAVESNGGYTF